MSDACKCGIAGTGVSDCFKDVNIVQYIYIQDIVDSEGNLNRLELTDDDSANKTIIEDLIYSDDPKKRLNVIGPFYSSALNVTERNDAVNRGVGSRIDDLSNYTLTAKITDVPSSYEDALNQIVQGCGDKGVYYVYSTGRVVGAKEVGTDGFAYPRRIQKNVFKAEPSPRDGSDANGLNITVIEDVSEKSAKLRAWTYGDLTATVATIKPLSVTITDQGTTSTDLVIKGTLLYGAINDPFVYENTATALVYVNGVADTTGGVFDEGTGNLTFTFAAPFVPPVTLTAQIKGGGYYSNILSIDLV